MEKSENPYKSTKDGIYSLFKGIKRYSVIASSEYERAYDDKSVYMRVCFNTLKTMQCLHFRIMGEGKKGIMASDRFKSLMDSLSAFKVELK